MRLSFRKAILLYTLVPISAIFILFALENLHSVDQMTSQSIEQHMTDLSISYASIFDGLLMPVAGAAKTNAELMEIYPDISEEEILAILEFQVAQNPLIYGAAIAFMPNQYDKDRRLVAPYVHRNKGQLQRMDIGQSGYDYTDPEWEWWSNPAATGKAAWTEPYFDVGAGNILMSTYAVPFYKAGKMWGVATIDIPLHELSETINIPGVQSQEIIVLSATGKIILFPGAEDIGNSVYDTIEKKFRLAKRLLGDDSVKKLLAAKAETLEIITAMLKGKTGKSQLPSLDVSEDYWYFFAPINSADWSFAIRVKESEVFKSVKERFWYSLLFFGLLLMLIIFSVVVVSGKFSQALEWLINRCQRIERLNFQPADDQRFKINELWHMSRTLNTMARALNVHFSIKEDVRIAQAIRQQSIAADIPQLPGYEIAVFSCSGDLGCAEIHDVFKCKSPIPVPQNSIQPTSETVALMILDDANKGIDAPVRNIQARAIYRTLMNQGRELTVAAALINDYLLSDSQLNGPLQAWFGLLDSKQAKLTSLNLGHHVVCHYSAVTNSLQTLTTNSCPLATQRHMPELIEQSLALADGDLVVAVSDGVVGALNSQRIPFGLAGLQQLIQRHSLSDAETLLEAIKFALEQYTATAADPVEFTLMVIKRCVEK